MPLKVLKEVFGFDSFRPGQEEVIKAVLEGRDTLAVMPTGGGKSLCYQIPALMRRSLTVIVSPLISLMKDQVDSLLQSEVAGAAALHSGLSPEERWEVERGVRTGETKMLYVAPERLRSLEFVLSLRRAGVGLFVVDEAHCVSEWGHDFRPDYLFLPRVVRDLGGPPVLALTATATPRVRKDIVHSMRMENPAVVVTSFNRPNLTYRVVEVEKNEDKLPEILEKLRALEPPGIVYAFSRKECEEITSGLKRNGTNAAVYHAGLGAGERSRVQEGFMTDEVDVVVATVAFGMGVDKPNVRFVVHATVPGSLPAYIQESGRAGRDGLPSECIALYRGADVGKRKGFVARNASGGEKEVAAFFRAAASLEREGRVNVSQAALGRLGGVEPDEAGTFLRVLEDAGAISRGYDLWESVEVRRLDEETEGLREGLREGVRAVHAALPGSGDVDLVELARRAGVRPAVAQGAVYSMMADGVVEAVGRGALLDLRLRRPELDGALRSGVATRMKDRTSAAYDQLRGVEAFANLQTCRREYLLRHFGDEEKVAPCSGCDVCLGEVESPGRRTEPAGLPEHLQSGAREVDPDLFERLKAWRSAEAKEQGVPAYVVLHNSHLEEIAARKPRTVHGLGAIKGIGLRRAARYGEALISLLNGDQPPDASEDGYQTHLQTARNLLDAGRGADAVEHLFRALKTGGEEARKAVDEMLGR